MKTFDQILPELTDLLKDRLQDISQLDWLLINRDLNGRVRFVIPDCVEQNGREWKKVEELYRVLAGRIAPHAHPVESGIMFEPSREQACQGVRAFSLEGFANVWVVDRLVNETRWESISDVAVGVPRMVFFSIKGGVGRSTALTASAWALGRQGKKVLVLDLDLESPGLSSGLLPDSRQPKYGITDWLVEDLVGNGDALIKDLYATSDLPMDGVIYLVPAHGREPGEYVSKLGRVWMPKMSAQTGPEPWSCRLNRLLNQLAEMINPDVILIDSRAGIDEVGAACVTDLGADTILLFAIQGQQTWTGYQSLFSHWRQRGVITDIRDRLQLVAGLVPDDERKPEHLKAFRQDAYKLFESIYDELGPGETEGFNFEQDDKNAPHNPLAIRWNRGWYGLLSLQERLENVNESDMNAVYGELLDFFDRALPDETPI